MPEYIRPCRRPSNNATSSQQRSESGTPPVNVYSLFTSVATFNFKLNAAPDLCSANIEDVVLTIIDF